jgi:hypothetical protein
MAEVAIKSAFMEIWQYQNVYYIYLDKYHLFFNVHCPITQENKAG